MFFEKAHWMRARFHRFPLLTLACLGLMSQPVAAQLDKPLSGEPPVDMMFDDGAPKVPTAQFGKRVLTCHVRHATNIDPSREQAESEIVYAESHDFTLELAPAKVPYAVGVGTERPGEAPAAGYRVVEDPGKLFEMAGHTFDRMADYWPKHVEAGKTIMGKAFSYIVLDQDPADPTRMFAFVSRAMDAVALDLTWMHRGQCEIQPTS
jgi:hypothetical protein